MMIETLQVEAVGEVDEDEVDEALLEVDFRVRDVAVMVEGVDVEEGDVDLEEEGENGLSLCERGNWNIYAVECLAFSVINKHYYYITRFITR